MPLRSLDAAMAARAAHDGAAMALAHGTYNVRPWVIYESRDPLRAEHGRAGIDGVILETPFERVRYGAYLDAMQGTPVGAREVARLATEARSSLGVLVYAHSRSEDDRAFLAGFRDASISTGARRYRPRAIERFGPSSDFYDVGSFREERWTGSVTFRFDRPACAERSAITIRDPYGRVYRIDVDTARFR